jgi:hypothetical protein
MTAPAGDVLREFLSVDKPSLILIDELMNYVSRNRKSGMATQLYNFVQNLRKKRGQKNLVLAVSIPASKLEMNDVWPWRNLSWTWAMSIPSWRLLHRRPTS